MMSLLNFRLQTKDFLLLFIIVLGTLLRMYHLGEIPFTHDELSVVFRTGYSSFGELISQGVMPDVHPAGIQVFVNYWVALFGDGEIAVKIPFILFGIVSIFLVYKLGEEWFGQSAGLASAAFVSAMEYMVMHSQTARPYVSGLMFGLLMVYAWQRYLFRPGKQPAAWLLSYVLASALCAYNHYFSLMFAALVGVTGLFFIKRRQILPYCLAGVGIFLLFMPHLEIFLFHFQEKGVEGWLAKPGNDFILNYIGYVFHFSPYVLLIVAGIVLAGIFSGQSRFLIRNKFFYICLAWFIIPFLTGFLYSRYVSAVLQFRVLIFYFPFLLFLFTGNLPELKKPMKIALPLLICLVVSLTLIFERQYYKLYYRSRFKELIVETVRSLKIFGTGDCLVFMDSHQRISDYYYDKLDIHYDHHHLRDFASKKEFIGLMDQSDKEYLSLGADSQSELVLPNIILDRYPAMKKIDYHGGNYYLFSKHDSLPGPYRLAYLNGFDRTSEHWSAGIDSLYVDTTSLSNQSSYFMDAQHEFGPSFSMPLRNLVQHKNDLIDVSVSIRNVGPVNNSLLVLSLKGKKELVAWTAGYFSDFDPATGEWYTVYHTFRPGNYFRDKNLELQVYVWNRDKKEFLQDDFKVKSRSGNPVLFGLREKI
ncbi:glycosyltransferase family 39 protein [Bacteroidota bacterium]